MGFIDKLKSVNNSWGYVTYLSDGSLGRIFGRIGPKNMVDNRSQELMITSGTLNGPLKDEIVFAAKDVKRATVLQATSEWVKYRLELNTGLVAIVVMTVMGLPTGTAQGNKTTLNANFNDAWLNFEAWIGEALERGYTDTSCALPVEKINSIEVDHAPSCKNEAPEFSEAPKKDLSVESAKESAKVPSKATKEADKHLDKKDEPEPVPVLAEKIAEDITKSERTQAASQEDLDTTPEKASDTDNASVEDDADASAEDDAETDDEDPEEYIDVSCPKCKESLSFIGYEKGEVACPFCDFKFSL